MSILFYIFAIGCLLLIGTALLRPQLIYEYPYFMAATFTAFVLPQAYALMLNDWGGNYFSTTLVMSSLCLFCCWFGYRFNPHPLILRKFDFEVDFFRLLGGGILIALVGIYFMWRYASYAEAEREGGLLTGIGTIYLFFGGLIYPGFALCFYCAVKKGWLVAWSASLVAAVIPIREALYYGRREPTALFILSVGLSLYFVKGLKPTRWMLFLAIFGAMVLIPATGAYRKAAKEDPLQAIRNLDVAEEFENSLDEDAVSELKNATALIGATEVTGNYQLGTGYWNALVFRFVPAQFLGKDFKDSLMIGSAGTDFGDYVEQTLGMRIPVGSTVTGIGDAFLQFGYCGCLFFAAVGYLFKSLWRAARGSSSVMAQIFYIQITTSAMRAVTHETVDFLPGFIYSAIFIGVVGWFARVHPSHERAQSFRIHANSLPVDR